MSETATKIAAGSRWRFGPAGSIYEIVEEPEDGDRYVQARIVGSTGSILQGTPLVEIRAASLGTSFQPAGAE